MWVVNLVSWGGHNFAHDPGDLVDLPDDIALARVEAGLAELVPSGEPVRQRGRRER